MVQESSQGRSRSYVPRCFENNDSHSSLILGQMTVSDSQVLFVDHQRTSFPRNLSMTGIECYNRRVQRRASAQLKFLVDCDFTGIKKFSLIIILVHNSHTSRGVVPCIIFRLIRSESCVL